MKNPVFSLFALLLLGFTFTSCKKDNSVLEEQLNGHWSSLTVRIDNTDQSKFYSYDLFIQADKTFSLTLNYTPSQLTGAITQATEGGWAADADEQTITLTNNETNVSTVYKVKSIDESSMIVKNSDNNKETEITFVKK